MKWLDARTVERVAIRALASNGQVIRSSLRTVEWDISGKCRSPVLVQLNGRPLKKSGPYVLPKRGLPMHVDLWTRCRKCDPCLHARRLLWQDKGRFEYANAPRTWLLTLTNRPDRHAYQQALVRRHLHKQGLDYDALPFGEQFELLAREMGKEVTKFLKRLRKNSGAPFRYLAVTEMHKSGAPHLHLLLHEQDMMRPLRKNMIQSCWRDGFSNCKLVEDVRQAVYVCKYLSKTKVARVRASLFYGSERTKVEVKNGTTSGVDERSEERNSTPQNKEFSDGVSRRGGPQTQVEDRTPLVYGRSISQRLFADKRSEQHGNDESVGPVPEGLDVQPRQWRPGEDPPARNNYERARESEGAFTPPSHWIGSRSRRVLRRRSRASEAVKAEAESPR